MCGDGPDRLAVDQLGTSGERSQVPGPKGLYAPALALQQARQGLLTVLPTRGSHNAPKDQMWHLGSAGKALTPKCVADRGKARLCS